jgi:hypothetical protein
MLVKSYFESYGLILLLLPLAFISLFAIKLEDDNKYILYSIGFICIAIMLENLILKQHAIEYNFSRLKMALLFAISVSLIFAASRKIFILLVIPLTSFSAFSTVINYSSSRTFVDENISRNKALVFSNSFKNDCDKCLLGMNMSVRGYTNLLFNRGVLERQTMSSLNEELKCDSSVECGCFIDVTYLGGGGMVSINGYEKINKD